MYNVQYGGRGRGWVLNSGALVSNRQNTASPKYNDDISLFISAVECQQLNSDSADGLLVFCSSLTRQQYFGLEYKIGYASRQIEDHTCNKV